MSCAKEAEEAKAKKEREGQEGRREQRRPQRPRRGPSPGRPQRPRRAPELRTEAAEAKKRPEPKEAAEAKKRPEPKETAEAKKRPEPKETAEAKKGPEPKETAEAEKGPESKETAENAQKGSEPTEAKEKAAPLVKRQPMPPKVKAMPKKAGKVKKVVLKSRAQPGIPERVDTALRMLSTKKRERKKMGYLVKAINHAMRRKAEKPERTASPAHLGPAHQGPLCPDQGQGAAVRRGHGVRDHSGCSLAGDGAAKDATGAAKDATGGAKDATRSGDQDRGWFRVASAATGATNPDPRGGSKK